MVLVVELFGFVGGGRGCWVEELAEGGGGEGHFGGAESDVPVCVVFEDEGGFVGSG